MDPPTHRTINIILGENGQRLGNKPAGRHEIIAHVTDIPAVVSNAMVLSKYQAAKKVRALKVSYWEL